MGQIEMEMDRMNHEATVRDADLVSGANLID